MKTELLIKNIILEDLKKFDLITQTELEKLKDNQISNHLIDLLIGYFLN